MDSVMLYRKIPLMIVWTEDDIIDTIGIVGRVLISLREARCVRSNKIPCYY